MKNRRQSVSLFWPLLLIGLGLLLLLQNFGRLPPGVWGALVPLWPVLLVVLGLDMLVGRRSWWGGVVVTLAGALLVAGALTWAAIRATTLTGGETRALIQTPLGAQTAAVRLEVGVGDLDVAALGPSLSLMEGDVVSGGGDGVTQSYGLQGSTGQLQLVQWQNALLTPFLYNRMVAPTHWAIRLSPDLPLTLDIHTGVGKANLDLSALHLGRLDLKTGLGQTFVTFPAGQATVAKIQAGLGDVTLTLPPDVPARITVTSGFANVHIPARFARAEKVYTTAGFTTTGPYLDLEVEAGLGSVTVY
jgi:hypothetical protein